MSNSTLILPQELKGTLLEERNNLYSERYGFTLDEIVQLSRLPSGFGKIESICEAITGHCDNGKVDPNKIGAQLTLAVIGGLYRNPWDGDYSSATSSVNAILMERYRKQIERKSLPNLRLTSTHFLRMELGVYSGNLPEAMKKGHKFYATDYDLKESLRLPLKLGFNEALLIGIAYSEACIANDSPLRRERSGRTKNLVFRGMDYEAELPLYEKIAQMLKTQFNYITKVKCEQDETPQGKVYVYPKIEVASSAIATWFANHLCFPVGKERDGLQFPHYINTKSLEDGFFAGYVGAKGIITKGWIALVVHCQSKSFLERISRISSRHGIRATIRRVQPSANPLFKPSHDTYVLRIGKPGINVMYGKGLLINPTHLEAICSIRASDKKPISYIS